MVKNSIVVRYAIPNYARSLWNQLVLGFYESGSGVPLFDERQAKAHDVVYLKNAGLIVLIDGVYPKVVAFLDPGVNLTVWVSDFAWLDNFKGMDNAAIYEKVSHLDPVNDSVELGAIARAVLDGLLSPVVVTGEPEYN